MLKVEDIHSDDINWVDWNKNNSNLLLTGSSDNTVSIIDIRNCKSIKYFDQHQESVNYVKWSPFNEKIFASAADSLMLWNLNNEGNELVFNHWGHVGPIIDFDWNWADPWTWMTTSDDSDSTIAHDEGSFHIFRPLSLIVDDFDKSVEELTKVMQDT